LHVCVDVNNKIVVVLKSSYVILLHEAPKHVCPTTWLLRLRARGLNIINRWFLLLLKIPKQDVLYDRLIGGAFGDYSECQHMWLIFAG
jgi:hypothetical protein